MYRQYAFLVAWGLISWRNLRVCLGHDTIDVMLQKAKKAGELLLSRRPKVRIPRPVRNVLISSGVLLILFVVAGVVYVFVVGRSSALDTKAVALPVAAPTRQEIKPTAPATNAVESAAVELITSPVALGSNASISVKTNAKSSCAISVVYNNVASTDSGLGTKVADEYGTISWTWTVSKTAPVGTWPVKVTCVYNSRSAVVQADLQVTK